MICVRMQNVILIAVKFIRRRIPIEYHKNVARSSHKRESTHLCIWFLKFYLTHFRTNVSGIIFFLYFHGKRKPKKIQTRKTRNGRKISRRDSRIDSRDYTSSSKSTKDFVWRPAAAVTFPARAPCVLARLFVSAHRCIDSTTPPPLVEYSAGRRRGAIIYRQPRVIYAPAEWARAPYRRKTRLIKYRAICHGSLWCDRERIILWISSSARPPHFGPPPRAILSFSLPLLCLLEASLPLSFWERITRPIRVLR